MKEKNDRAMVIGESLNLIWCIVQKHRKISLVKQRERGRERKKEIQREGGRERGKREGERQTDRERGAERGRQRHTQTERGARWREGGQMER